ncbi:MAG: serine hydrolase, partial [Gammaproteobacteria bacterium]|nr:serine hydrolase [Gammaproteobacteria bacterium]
MRTLKIFIIVLLIVLVGLSIKFFPLGQKLYVLATLDDPDRIVRNLRDMEKIAEHRVIDKSSAPYSLPRALPATDRRFALPKTFESLGKTFETAAFLDETQSTGILILHNGKVVYEDYARGLTETITHSAFSVSKSFTSALVGLAIDDGYIGSEHDPVVEYLPGLKGTGYDGVTIAQCMEMASGAKFSERYDGAESDMDRFKRHFALGRPIIDFLKTIEPGKKPGSYNGYNSLDAQVVGMV